MINDDSLEEVLEGDDNLQIMHNIHILTLKYVGEIKEVIKKGGKAKESDSFEKLERIVNFFSDKFSKENENRLANNLSILYDYSLDNLILIKKNNNLKDLHDVEIIIKKIINMWAGTRQKINETTH